MELKKVCENCDYFIHNQHCSLTGIATHLDDTCEMHKPKIRFKNTRTVISFGTVFLILLFAYKLYDYNTPPPEDVKRGKDILKTITENQIKFKAQLKLLNYTQGKDSMGLKRYTGTFLVSDNRYTEQFFRDKLQNFYDKIPDSISGFHKIFVENNLYILNGDFTMNFKTKICGYLEYVGDRKYFYELPKN